MNKEHCLINLTPLKASEHSFGYSQIGIKQLFGNKNINLELPFTRHQFIQEQPQHQKGMSISGYQPKLSLRIEKGEFQVVSDKGMYILKPSPEAYPYLAENEHATMRVMQRLGFAVPPFGLIYFKRTEHIADELAFIVKRYDRLEPNGEKIHQEQLDGAMEIDDKYGNVAGRKRVSYERAAKFLIKAVSDSLASKRDIFLRTVYAYVLGNNDYHLRNMGIIHPYNGKPRLAPIYDFISVVPYASVFNEYLALPLLEIEENNNNISPGLDSVYGEYIGADFILFAQGMGLNSKLAKKLLLDVIKSHPIIIETYTASHMQAEDREKILRYVARRMTLLNITEL
ncbi:type II toxin-antitoxin system HipA family toxin [Providencia rettgeri]|uniref:type II toxin-antitoxin system HipA family toxin n=1 Tax=Providencia rettgeri TaxID=587 RepID=UPI0034E0914C